MKKTLLYSALLLTTTALACEPASDPTGIDAGPQFAKSSKAPVHMVSAGGQVDYEFAATEVYGLTASVDADGNVKGQLESHWGELRFHLDITCLSVADNTAWVGGVITRSNNPGFPEGQEWVFNVTDNGQGKNADPDQLSYWIPLAAADCVSQPEIFKFDWARGNVQVK